MPSDAQLIFAVKANHFRAESMRLRIIVNAHPISLSRILRPVQCRQESSDGTESVTQWCH